MINTISIKPNIITKRGIQPKEYRIFRLCVARYGYNDVIGEPNKFEQQLVEQLKEFIRNQNVTSLIEGERNGEKCGVYARRSISGGRP
jgi:hypothetical protein